MPELTKLHEFTSLFKLLFHISIYVIILNPFLIKFILSKTRIKKIRNVFAILGTLIEIIAFVPIVLLAIDSDVMIAVSTIIFYCFADFMTFWPLLLLGIIIYLFIKIVTKRKTKLDYCLLIDKK